MGLRFLAAAFLMGGIVVSARGGVLVYHFDFNSFQRSKESVIQVLEKVAAEGYNAVLWEIENKVRFDCCPDVAASDAFSKEEFREILSVGRKLGLEPIPLMQTFGHAEYVLRHKKYFGLRERPDGYDCYCPSSVETRKFLKKLLHEYLEVFGVGVRRFHLGGDEAWSFGSCPVCRSRKAIDLYREHLESVAEELHSRGIRPGCWHDMLLKFDRDAGGRLFEKEFKGYTIWFWDYSYPKVWHWWGQSDGPLRSLMSSGCETIICGSAQSWKEDPFLVRYEEHRRNLSACAELAARESLSGFCVTSWTVHQGLKQLQYPLYSYAARRYRNPTADADAEWSDVVQKEFGNVPTNALEELSRWEVRFGVADGRAWTGYKDGLIPPKDGLDARLAKEGIDAVKLGNEIDGVVSDTEVALKTIKDLTHPGMTALGRLLVEAGELRLGFHKVQLAKLRGKNVGILPFRESVTHYLREYSPESAERAARIIYAYYGKGTDE